ncbi:MAG: thiolase family protein [Actinomycetes bacterium]
MTKPEHLTVISGVGQSDVGRRLFRDPLELTLDACVAAIEDAGLTTADIDGISTYPGPGGQPPGFSGAGAVEVHDALRLNLGWWSGGIERPSQLGAVVDACLAVAFGLARHVLCFRSVFEGSAQGQGGRAAVMPGGGSGRSVPRASGFQEWVLPFGAPSAAPWIALMAQRHFHEFGTTPEQLGQIAVNARRNAALNPQAIYTDTMTIDDYLASRVISSPLRLFDCDVPCDGGTAVIVSHVDTIPDLRKAPVRIEALGTALYGRPSWDQFDDLTTMGLRDAATQMWSRTDMKPSDVDVAEMYDGFSFIALCWLEAMGFCGKGEAGAFLEGGRNIAIDGGVLPLNTNGGQLSSGRLHGFGFMHEACVQLWGEGGARQVAGDPEVAVACAGGGPMGGAFLLTRSR